MHETAGSTQKLSAKQEKAIACLLSEGSVTHAAAKAGIADRTLFGWLKDPSFAAAYRAARREAVSQAVARLQQLSSAAVLVLAHLMADRTTPASVRMHAAKTILEFAIRAVELEAIDSRLSALEQAYAEKR